ncbi:helix-turn-helix domain-containing protein [Bacillus sp. OK048]|uniref:response regulator transcription factor n=1 Tax=Bacillus sp. OK048 TaxID=1882761 RepID=UPI0008819688|nr:helix-turn-helix domain-containing protein [Bacillus sp. OK048]SDM91939.1 two component transcriptional regulator, AraC family [Bacillus sp. OK048]
MYKVILVDDDYHVLEFLDSKIPWGDLGFTVMGLYQDGEQALESMGEEYPDVIITDIGMPIMNGIDLVKNAKNLNLNFHSIILTCHDDFSYVQQALRLNSFDYILKETIDTDSLRDILLKLKEKLDKQKEDRMLIAGLEKVQRAIKNIHDQPKNAEILRAQEYVLMNLDKKITLGEVADHLHLNPSYFSRLYKKSTNENFFDYVNRAKMEKAKELIETSNEPIENIAYRLGFESKSYFLRTFKKYFGLPPKLYKLSQ